MFSYAKFQKDIEVLQKRTLRFLYDDDDSPLDEILKKSCKVYMDVSSLWYLRIEIYKRINNINLSFMKKILQLREANGTVRN